MRCVMAQRIRKTPSLTSRREEHLGVSPKSGFFLFHSAKHSDPRETSQPCVWGQASIDSSLVQSVPFALKKKPELLGCLGDSHEMVLRACKSHVTII